jgi:DNA/RNA endonuclease YhcR with UshA esterase domain
MEINSINLLKISLTISLIGILLLLLISNILEPKLLQIKDIKENLIDKNVKLEGKISNIQAYKESDFQIISIKDKTGKIDVTLDKIINLNINQTIIVIGKVTLYKGFLEIQANKIILK